MPLYRHSDKLIFFAHVPKCAGTSVSEYLSARFGKPAFEDRAFLRSPQAFPWTRTSPQHIPVDALDRILPQTFIDYSFAVVRHPVSRIASVYRFQKSSQRAINRFISLDRWLDRLPRQIKNDPFRYDGHALPQVRFLPRNVEIFKLEDGLDRLIARLDEKFGEQDQTLKIGHSKKSKKSVELTPSQIDAIRKIYSVDFEQLDYE